MTSEAIDTAKHGVDGFVNGVPAAWTPSRNKPVPVIQCTATANSTGERCRRMSLRGATTCVKHGAQLPTVREHAEAVVESGRLRILNNVDMAIDVLERLMQPGTAEAIMLKASTEILDRANVKGSTDINVEISHAEAPADLLRERLTQLAAAREADAPAEVLDAEVVPEPEQDTLF